MIRSIQHKSLYFILFALCFFLAGCSSSQPIVHTLEERDANDILVFLDNHGIKAWKVQSAEAGGGGGQKIVLWDIYVPADLEKQAMALLNNAGLPRKSGQNLLSIFSKSGLVPSEMEEQIRYRAGLAEQIASTIRKIDGVVDADVQLSFPEEDPLNPEKKRGEVTASVYVKHTGVLDDPNSQLITKIRRLVASSIQGLKFDNVTVIPDRARFSDVSQRPMGGSQAEQDWVKIWTMTIAKDSSMRFRVVFFSFLFLILILLVVLGWTIWKVYPLLPKETGLREYFEFHPYEKEEATVAETPPPAEKPPGEDETGVT